MEKMAMYEALNQAAGANASDPNVLAHDCAAGYDWYIGWAKNPTAKDAVAGWLANADFKKRILSPDCSDDPAYACAVGIGVAIKGTSIVWTLAFDSSLGNDPLTWKADDPTNVPVWPVAGWPAIPTAAALPSSNGGGSWTTINDTTHVCFASSSQCGQVSIDATWTPNDALFAPVRHVSVCVSLASWDDGSSAALTPRLAAATVALHIDSKTVRLAGPGWTAASDGSESCMDATLPQLPRFGRHTVWLTLSTAAGSSLSTSKRFYGLSFVPVSIRATSAAKLVYQHGQPAYDLISGVVGSPLFALASAHPITVLCVEARSNGAVRKVDSTVVVRAPLGPNAGARCVFRVKPPFGIFLEARVKLTPWLSQQLGGVKLRYSGVRFG